MSEVGAVDECQAVTKQEEPKGGTPHLRSGAAAGRSYPMPDARGSGHEELPHAQGQGGGREEQPHVQGEVAARMQEGLEELFHIQVQEGWQ